MKCPYCDKEMENGEVKVVDTMFNMVSNLGWYPENEIKKMVKKNYVDLKFKGEGYYCEDCMKVVGIFDQR